MADRTTSMRGARVGVGLAVLGALAACAPPPEITVAGSGTGEASVELIYPPSDVGIPLTQEGVGPNAELYLDLLVVVSVDGLEYVPPVPDPEDVEGQGHYHFNVNGAYVDAPPAKFYEYRSDEGEFKEGDRVQISVTLASNTHQDLDQFTDWIDVIEFDVLAPDPGSILP